MHPQHEASFTKDRTPDQLAIATYFASESFAWARQGKREKLASVGGRSIIRAWTLELESEDRLSVGLAFYGMGVFWLLTSIAVPYGIYFLGGFNNQTFPLWMAMVQLTFAPMMAFLTLISCTAALWYVPLPKRFALAAAVVGPGLLMLTVGIAQLRWIGSDEAVRRTIFQSLAFCITCGSLVLPIQMWGRWSLTHARERPQEIPPLGTRAMLELTLVASVVFAIAYLARDRDVIREMFVAAFIAAACTAAVISVYTTWLSRRRRGKIVAALPTIGFAFIAMLCVNLQAFSIYDETIMWNTGQEQGVIVAVTAAIGSCVFVGCLYFGQFWLRACGWQCVRGQAKAGDA